MPATGIARQLFELTVVARRYRQARSLFESAREPKEIRWYNGGHWPIAPMIAETADWLADRLAPRRAQSRLA